MMLRDTKSKVNLAVASWLILYTGIASAASMRKPTEVETEMRQKAPASPSHAPYFRMSEEQRHQFMNKVNQIHLGDTRDRVVSLMGKPDANYSTGPKKTPKPIKRLVWYYVTRYDKDLVNERFDERVFFTFDVNDRLKSINSNIPGIPNQP